MKTKKRSRKMPKAHKRLGKKIVYDFSDKDKFFAWFFLLTSLLLAIALLYATVINPEHAKEIPCNVEHSGYVWVNPLDINDFNKVKTCIKQNPLDNNGSGFYIYAPNWVKQ